MACCGRRKPPMAKHCQSIAPPHCRTPSAFAPRQFFPPLLRYPSIHVLILL
jgi:hypothetical protein